MSISGAAERRRGGMLFQPDSRTNPLLRARYLARVWALMVGMNLLISSYSECSFPHSPCTSIHHQGGKPPAELALGIKKRGYWR
jgi:hypothetical protein